jgi:hypothetical protein
LLRTDNAAHSTVTHFDRHERKRLRDNGSAARAAASVRRKRAAVAARRRSACEGQNEGELGAAGRLSPELPAVGLDDSGAPFGQLGFGYGDAQSTSRV